MKIICLFLGTIPLIEKERLFALVHALGHESVIYNQQVEWLTGI